MSATISCLTPQRSSFFRAPATPGPALFFSTLMSDEAKTIARGLQKRDPDLLDRLIEQYQYRLFRYLVYVTGNKERAEDFFQETWIRVLERGHQYDGKSKFETWLFAIYREVLVLRFQEELQIDEMAGVLSIPLSTVKSRLYRGLEALRGALQGGAA